MQYRGIENDSSDGHMKKETTSAIFAGRHPLCSSGKFFCSGMLDALALQRINETIQRVDRKAGVDVEGCICYISFR